MPAYKIASADLTNWELLDEVARLGRPLIVSTGMSTEGEIAETARRLRGQKVPFALLHCNSTYPAPFKDVNLRYLDRLSEIGQCAVGYSGHERGYAVAVAAVARGAAIVEKHITLDRAMKGVDHKVSLEPGEFAAMVESIRQVEQALGSTQPRRLSQGERINRDNLAKSLVAARRVDAGAVIEADMIEVRAPGRGLQPNRRQELIGQVARRTVRPGEFFFEGDLAEHRPSDGAGQPREYRFRRPWGVPVRYHDWRELWERAPTADFLEFHLSYGDMDLEPGRFFPDGPVDCGLAVHSPDLFRGDHLLNLAAEDSDYRQRSRRELQRAIDTARRLREYFRQDGNVIVIASLGGFSEHAPLAVEDRPRLYERVARSVAELDTSGVELVAQTLPPFPWYLGGQRFCNLFVDAADTAGFCRDTGLGLCFDVSHSQLTCNERGQGFGSFAEAVASHTRHLHLVDAQGVDGEGLQIGDGDVDFAALAEVLDRECPKAGFIPEIWQGHKRSGEGFWIALDRLESWF